VEVFVAEEVPYLRPVGCERDRVPERLHPLGPGRGVRVSRTQPGAGAEAGRDAPTRPGGVCS
jgi:hypothetical protein